MFLNPRALKSLRITARIQSIMMCATFNCNPSNTIVSYCRPMNFRMEMEIMRSYIGISSLVRHIPKDKVLIIG